MSPTTSLRAYSRHRGCTLSSVQEAITRGRLAASIVRDDRGRPKIADVELADREWSDSTLTGHVPLTIRAKKVEAGRPGRAQLVAALVKVVEEIQRGELECISGYLPDAVTEAHETLTEAGRPATTEALAEALRLAAGADGPVAEIVLAITEAARDMDSDRAKIRARARAAGRQAVVDFLAEGGADGQP